MPEKGDGFDFHELMERVADEWASRSLLVPGMVPTTAKLLGLPETTKREDIVATLRRMGAQP
jgi:hypothetical protein